MKINQILEIIKSYKVEIIIVLVSFIFSTWLMFSTFGYKDGHMLIASKAWSDFASHIPLIRSFSFGNNFPPQYPLFSGPPIRYHFIFYAIVGLLEKGGLRIDYALNIPSILGFSLLMTMIYVFAIKLFKSKIVGILSVLFLIFNGSLDFIKFFSLHPISINTISEVINNQRFISFGPYDSSTISAFWNLNIYTNQRHLGLSYFISLIIIYFILKPFLENKKMDFNKNLLIGVVFALSFLLNIAVFLMTAIILLMFFVFLKGHRKNIFLTLALGTIIALPQYLFIQQGGTGPGISFYPGYLVTGKLTFQNILSYWLQNLGLHLLLIPLGLIIAPKKIKIIFISFLALFIVGNLFKFSPEIAANHKFFNYFMIFGSIFSAYSLNYLWKRKNIFKPFVAIIFFFLVISGIINFFPIFNDNKIVLADYPVNQDIDWIMKNTKADSVFLNTQFLYDNASLAGRKIFLGWPYFSWSQGYNTDLRGSLMKDMLGAQNKEALCTMLKNNNINYIEISTSNLNDPNLPKISETFQSFIPIHKNENSNYFIDSVKINCQNI